MKGHNPYGFFAPSPNVRHQAPEVIHITQDDHPALQRNLLASLQTERSQRAGELILAKDWPDFEKRRGLVHGLDAAISLCETAQRKLEA